MESDQDLPMLMDLMPTSSPPLIKRAQPGAGTVKFAPAHHSGAFRAFTVRVCSFLLLLVFQTQFSSSVAQEAVQHSAFKIESPSSSSESSDPGVTYVALAQGLESVFSGREPVSLQELRALETQQSKVARAIETVTVNVQQGAAQGSGVIITADGYVLTAAHVAGAANRDASIVLSDGTRVEARTLGLNRDKDAGLLKIVSTRSSPWPHATLGRSSELKEGQWVVASGHPGGWKADRGSVIRVGRILSIISGGNKRLNRGHAAHTLFTDCALIGGDSGGPLFTLEGKLIGIHSRIGTDVVDNMHVPIDVFSASWDKMVRKEVWGVLPGYRPVIGVAGTKSDDRPLISFVTPGGAAHKAGIEAGDLILTFDGQKITTFAELRLGVEARMPGDVITLTVQRGDNIYRLAVTIGVADN